jgi:hypothetical protein
MPHVARAVVLSLLLGVSAHAASHTVLNGNDAGSGSFRQALLDANASPGADTIIFAGDFIVRPRSPLPVVTDTIVIEQNLRLDGAEAGAAVDGLVLLSSDNSLHSISVTNFSGNGIVSAAAAGMPSATSSWPSTAATASCSRTAPTAPSTPRTP